MPCWPLRPGPEPCCSTSPSPTPRRCPPLRELPEPLRGRAGQGDLDAAEIFDPGLRAAYQDCRRLAAHHGRTFFLAARLLPPAKRPHVHALYAFARVADEIVDAPGRDGRAEHLARWRESFCVEVRAGRSADPVRWAAIHTARRWDIPVEHFETFLASMAMDLTTTSYPTYEDLLRYVQGSAAVIGLQMVPILGALDERAYPAAEALGIAFQLANFVRDLGEDLDRGRLYLPLADLERFDLARADLDRRCVDDRVRALLAFEIARVRRLEAAARPGIEALEPTSRPCIDAARILYCGIADEVERIDYQVFDQRARVSMTRRLAVAARAWTRARRISRATSAVPLEGFAGSRGDPRTPTG